MSRKNTKKTPAAATDPASPEALCEVRNAAEAKRVDDTFLKEYPTLSRVFVFSPGSPDSADDGCLPFTTMISMMRLRLSGNESIANHAQPRQIRSELIDLLRCPYEFPCTYWTVRGRELIATPAVRKVVRDDELWKMRYALGDLLWQIGALARKIGSCESTRILRCLVAFKDRPWYRENYPQPEAERLADELIYCFDAVLTEVSLMDPKERAELEYPRTPRHRSEIIVDSIFPEDVPPEKCTADCRNAAMRRFRVENGTLLPMPWFDGTVRDPVRRIEEQLHRLAEEMEARRPSLDQPSDAFDYRTFGRILGANFCLCYDRYFMKETVAADGRRHLERQKEMTFESTAQLESKAHMIGDMRRYLSAAVALAAECGSETRGDWAEATALFERRRGEFYTCCEADEDAAAADLNAFLRLFRQARQRLWSDWERHCRADVHDKPVNTNPEGPAMTALRKDLGRVRDDTAHILYYDSDKKMGIGPADGRQKAPVRSDMVREAVEKIAGDSKHKQTLASVIAAVGKRYANQKGCYDISNKDDRQAFTKAIRRECAEQGVDVPKVGTGKWK